MKVILYMATSVNGNITSGESDSDWVDKADWKYFNKTTKNAGVMIMGSETYKQFENDFPQNQALNVVLTKKKNLLGKKIDGAIFTDKSPKEVIKMLSQNGYKKACFIGGETLNTSIIKENLVDEIYIDIHPLLIGDGKKLFGSIKGLFKKLKLLEVNKLNKGLILLHYRVAK